MINFRFAVAVLLVLSLATAGLFRARAKRSDEKISRRGEGPVLFVAIRLAGLALLLSTLAYLFTPRLVQWSSVNVPLELRVAGAPLGAFALVLLGWTLRTLGPNLTDTVATRREHTLVTNGPYRWVRHPFYSVTLLLVVATSLLAANWLIAATGLMVFALLAVRTPREERELERRFGDAYREYMRRTPRFVPRLSALVGIHK